MPLTAKRIRVAAYCRVSTKSDDQQNSYEVQVNYYTQYINSKPEWEFVDIYADPGLSGVFSKNRKRFNDLIRDALDDKIDLIIVKSVSRFARNTIDSISKIRALREKGVRVYFEKENIDSLDSKCDMILSIHASLAEDESRSISTNIRWSVMKRFEKGEVIMNFNNFYGYTLDANKKPVIVEKEAEVVRNLYFGYLIGRSYSDLIRDLQERGVPSPKGKVKWQKSTVQSILKNEKYMGDAIIQKTYKRDFLAPRRVKNTGQAPQKYVENNHPAIVDKTTWHAVQAETERRN